VHARSDAEQQLTFSQFSVLMRRVAMVAMAMGRMMTLPGDEAIVGPVGSNSHEHAGWRRAIAV
jgi:hypothetical protein